MDQQLDTLQKQNVLPSIGDLFSQGFESLSHIWLFSKILIFPLLLVFIIFGIGVSIFAFLFPPAIIGVAILFGLVVVTVSVWSQIAAMYVVCQGYAIRAQDAFSATKGMILSFLWISLLISFVIVGGFSLLIIPGIIFSVFLVFSGYALVCEGDKGLTALGKSFWYVRGIWWGVLGRLFLLWLVTAVFLGMLGGVFSLLGQIFGGYIGAGVADGLVRIVVAVIVTPFSFAYLYGMYQSLCTARNLMPTGYKKKFLFGFGLWGFVAFVFIIITFFALQDIVPSIMDLNYALT